ncbi:MAG: S9 family peptidase [Steroidobacterales bacterium]
MRHHTNDMRHFNHDLRRRARRTLAGFDPPALMLLILGCGTLQAQQATPATPAAQIQPTQQTQPSPQPLASQSTLTRDGLSAPDAAVAASLPRYLESRAARFVDWLLDGSMLIATRFGDTEQIHRVRAPLAMREQLSFAPGGVAAGAARPYASDAFAYLEWHHGGDSSQLFLQRLADHALTPLTDGAHRDGAALWAHDGRHIAFASNRRNGTDLDIYLLDTEDAGATPRLVVGGAGNRWHAYDWSIDDKRLLLGRELPRAQLPPGPLTAGVTADSAGGPESDLYIADVGSGEISAIALASAAPERAAAARKQQRTDKAATAAAPVRVRHALFATDGRGIVLLTGHGAPANGTPGGAVAPFQRLGYLDLSTHEWRELSTDSSHDVERFDRSPDGRYVAYTVNDAGNSRLMLIDQQRKLDLTVAALPAGIISTLKFDPTGKRLALTLESSRSPADVYVLEPDTQALTRWTQSEVGLLDPEGFVAPQLLHFPTWDRIEGQPRQLTALVYRPAAPGAGAAEAGARPVLVWLCGGGGGQCRPGFDPFLQWLVKELGVVVVAPNVRGSAGSGRELLQAGQGALRDEAARDIGSLLVWIDLQRDLDRNRVALLGEGYGAYLALQSLADYGDRLRGGIAAFPPPLSGLANGAAIRRPLLLVQGLDNPAVPAYQMEQLRSRLRADGVEVQYLAVAQEAEGFTRRQSRDAYHDAAANFLAQLLR